MRVSSVWHIVLVTLMCVSIVRCDIDEEDEDFRMNEDETEEIEIEPEIEPAASKPVYVQPKAKGTTFLTETFESSGDFKKRWVLSEAKKDDIDDNIAKYDGQWSIEEATDNALDGDLGLVLKSRAKHHAVSAKLDTPFEFTGKPFIMQYEVKFQNGQECGGAYVKLLSHDNKLDLKKFVDKTQYTIMFGPDKCGNENKLHFIFRHQNPVNGNYEEKHAKKATASLDSYFTDKKTHLYTLVVSPDNSFSVYVDHNLVNSGNMLEDMSPPVNPPKEIVDPDDQKPEDWDEREKMPDADAVKPDDWDETEAEQIVDPDSVKPDGWLDDEEELMPDPDSEMPEDWEQDMDGEWEPPMIQNPVCEEAPGCGKWEAPQIKNPKFKGKWRAPMIDNPNYKGKWKPRKIDNPDFFEDSTPYQMTSIGAVGLELWSMSDDIMFDNFIITDDKSVSDQWAADSWDIKHKQELAGGSSGRSVVQAVMEATNERPWLWAVFIIVILLPLVLIIAYCCMPGSSGKPEDLRASAKKTDAQTPDDPGEEDEDEEEDDNTTEDKQEETPDKGKGDSSPAKTKAKKSDLDADEDDQNEADNEDEDGTKPKSSPRKRKTKARKE